MARRKPTIPERSKIERAGTHAFARRTKGANEPEPTDPPGPGDGDGDGDGDDKPAAPAVAAVASEADAKPAGEGASPEPAQGASPAPEAAPAQEASPAPSPEASASPAPAPEAAPVGDAEAEIRVRSETVMMPTDAALGAPPDLPGGVEDPTNMPGPRNIPPGNPTDPAAAPGFVPKGDSRSLRRGADFALVYRTQTFLISRFGVVGTRGQWRVVEYPTPGAAGNSYARETSRYTSEGYSDYRG